MDLDGTWSLSPDKPANVGIVGILEKAGIIARLSGESSATQYDMLDSTNEGDNKMLTLNMQVIHRYV